MSFDTTPAAAAGRRDPRQPAARSAPATEVTEPAPHPPPPRRRAADRALWRCSPSPSAALAAAPKFPALTGRVVDDAHMLSPATAQKLDGELADLEAQTGHQLVVATVPDLQGHEIEDYGYQLGRAWQLGRKGVNDGAILLVAPSEHKVRIEVGYGLEPVLTDALTSVILQTQGAAAVQGRATWSRAWSTAPRR